MFDVPVEITLDPDGTVRVGMNEPVTYRFRSSVSVRDGRLLYSGDPETGTLTFYEVAGQRIPGGYVSPSSRSGPQAPAGYTIRVQWQGP